MQHRKRKQTDYYLSNEDIEKLNDRYIDLYRKIKNQETNIPQAQIDRMCEVLLAKYNFEIEELSALHEADYLKRQAQIAAKNKQQTPWRRCWLWRLLFMPLTNRAQDIIEAEAKLDAEELFAPMEEELEKRAKKLYGEPEPPEAEKTAPETAEQVTPESASEPSTVAPEAPEPPIRKPRKKVKSGA